MTRAHHSEANNIPTHQEQLAKGEERPTMAVRGGAPRRQTKARAGMARDGQRKAAILAGFARLVAVLLVAFTIYGFCCDQEILKDLLGFTEYLAAGVILWAMGPKMGSLLRGMAKAVTNTEDEE